MRRTLAVGLGTAVLVLLAAANARLALANREALGSEATHDWGLWHWDQSNHPKTVREDGYRRTS